MIGDWEKVRRKDLLVRRVVRYVVGKSADDEFQISRVLISGRAVYNIESSRRLTGCESSCYQDKVTAVVNRHDIQYLLIIAVEIVNQTQHRSKKQTSHS